MNKTDPNYGAKKTRSETRKYIYALIFMAVAGAIIGTLFSHFDGETGNIFTDTPETLSLHPGIAIFLTALTLLVLIIMPALGLRHMDELERRLNINATAFCGLAGLAAFPAWHLLSLGQLLPAPTALGMFVILIASGFISYAILKFRM